MIKNLPVPATETTIPNQETPSSLYLSKSLEKLDLDKSQMADLELELGKIIEYDSYVANAKREKARVEAFEKQAEYHKAFLNSWKFYLELKNYEDMNNYDAVIIEENKKSETSDIANKNLREYTTTAIQRMDEK